MPFDPAAVRTRRPGFSEVQLNGRPMRVFTFVTNPDGPPGFRGTIQVARDTQDLKDLWTAQWRSLAWMLPIALFLAAAGAYFLSGRAMKPIGQLRRAAESIDERNLDARLQVDGSDEFAKLTETFNGMTGRLQAAFGALESALEQQRQFTADASHELRTPLTRIRLAATSGGDPSENLGTIDRAATAMSRMVDDLLLLAKADAGRLLPKLDRVDLRLPASEAIDLLGSAVEFKAPSDAVWIEGDHDHVRRAITNLLSNAARFANGQPVTVQVLPEGTVTVTDQGPGIPKDALGHLGTRFYRVDEARDTSQGGTGLGLSIVRAIMDAHGGAFKMESEVGKGSTATLIFRKFESQTSSS